MEQIYTKVLDVMQTMAEIPAAAKTAGQEDPSKPGEFRELLQQKKAESAGTKDAKPSDSQSEPVNTGELPEENLVIAQEWLASQLLAADFLSVVQTPVIVPEDGTTAAEEPLAAAEPMVSAEMPEMPMVYKADTEMVSAPAVQPMEAEPAEAPVQPVETLWPEQTAPVQPQPQQDNGQPLPVEEAVTAAAESRQEDKEELPLEAEAPLFQDVQTVPIKVAEAEAPAETPETPSVETQVGDKLLEAVQKGESTVKIRLEPENLGSVTVEISQQDGGVLHIAIQAESLQTHELLEKHVPHLQMFLAERGQPDIQVEVQRQQESQQPDNRQNFQDGQNSGRGQHQQQERRQPSRQNQDFLHQLRLGLVPMQGMA